MNLRRFPARSRVRDLRATTLLSLASLCLGSALPLGAEEEEPETVQRINPVIEKMEEGEPVFGVFSSNLSVRTGANMAGSSLDFVIVDLEHSPYDVSRLEGYLLGMIDKRRVASGGLRMNTAPFVRVPASGREQLDYIIKQVLDLGPVGIVVPHVDTAEDALAMVKACRFPQLNDAPDFEPQGRRGVGYGWAARYWGLTGGEYARRADLWPLDPEGELVLWVMIESREAVENVAEIAAVPGIGGLFIGPSDLAFSLGVPLGDPAVEEAIEKILAAGKEAGVPVGTTSSSGTVERRLEQGFRFLTVGGDGGPSSGATEALRKGRAFRPE